MPTAITVKVGCLAAVLVDTVPTLVAAGERRRRSKQDQASGDVTGSSLHPAYFARINAGWQSLLGGNAMLSAFDRLTHTKNCGFIEVFTQHLHADRQACF